MIFLVIFATLIGSFFNASSGVIQRKAAGTPDPKELFGPRFVSQVVSNRLWLFGLLLQLLGFLLQAVALHSGSLIMVEPLWTMDLVFLMLLLHFRFSVPTGRREWGATAALCLGLSGLLIAAAPHGGHENYNGLPWLVAGVIGFVVVVGLAVLVRHINQPTLRAILAGTAAGLNFAYTAAFTKLAAQQLTSMGVGGVLTSWPVYALMISGIVSLITMQSAYGAGPLAVSTPFMEIVDPVASVFIGLLLFKDTINLGPGAVTVELLSAVAIIAGIVLLGGSKRIQEHSGL